jgi:tetratricopeptide (TPR) repeat protein
MADADEPSDFELLRQFLIAPERQFGMVTVTASDRETLEATRQRAADAVAGAGASLATLDVQPGSSLLDQMVAVGKDADVLFVDHLERVLFDSLGVPTVTADIELLNWDRDRLPKLLRAHTVFWLLPSAAHALALVARDLNDVVMSRYHFVGRAKAWPLEYGPKSPYYLAATKAPPSARENRLLDNLLASRPRGTKEWAEAAAYRARNHLQAGEPEHAERLWKEAFDIFDGRDAGRAAAAAFGLADITMRREGTGAGIEFARSRVLPRAELAGDRRLLALVHTWIAVGLLQLGRSDDGERELREHVLPTFTDLRDERQLAVAHRLLAGALLMNDAADEAARLLRGAVIPVFERLGDAEELAVSRLRLASTLAAAGDPDGALREFQATLIDLPRDATNVDELRAATLERIAFLLIRRGDVTLGSRIWRDQALPIYTKLGDVASVERIRQILSKVPGA